jgi:hypothetical protein
MSKEKTPVMSYVAAVGASVATGAEIGSNGKPAIAAAAASVGTLALKHLYDRNMDLLRSRTVIYNDRLDKKMAAGISILTGAIGEEASRNVTQHGFADGGKWMAAEVVGACVLGMFRWSIKNLPAVKR